jgi:phage/plasmid-like protein (TIGR03299 family)
MAHNVETMAWAGEVPWHGLGVEVSNDLSPMEMRKAAGLDWEVYKTDNFTQINGEWIATGDQSLVRDSDNRILSRVSDEWIPVSMEETFDFFWDFCHNGDMEMNTAGSLRDGEIIWALAKVKESFEDVPGDQVDSYLLLTNFFQYGRATDVRFTPVRVVCNNTLSVAIDRASKNMVKMNHRQAFDGDLVKEKLGIAKDKLESYQMMAQFLAKRKATKESVVKYFADVFPGKGLKNSDHEALKQLSLPGRMAYQALEEQPGAKFAEGSFWQAFNAVTFTIDHLRGNSDNTRMESAWYGAGAKTKNKALELAVDMAEKAPAL